MIDWVMPDAIQAWLIAVLSDFAGSGSRRVIFALLVLAYLYLLARIARQIALRVDFHLAEKARARGRSPGRFVFCLGTIGVWLPKAALVVGATFVLAEFSRTPFIRSALNQTQTGELAEVASKAVLRFFLF